MCWDQQWLCAWLEKTNQTNPERFTEKVKKKNNAIIQKMDFFETPGQLF